MGHYRSEMGFDEEDRKEAEQKAQNRRKTAENIQMAIDERGLAAVLAEIIEDANENRYWIGRKFR